MHRSYRIKSLQKFQKRKSLFNNLIVVALGLVVRSVVKDFAGLHLAQVESNREIVADFRANHVSQHFLEVLSPQLNRLA
jgi:hypothetical protein